MQVSTLYDWGVTGPCGNRECFESGIWNSTYWDYHSGDSTVTFMSPQKASNYTAMLFNLQLDSVPYSGSGVDTLIFELTLKLHNADLGNIQYTNGTPQPDGPLFLKYDGDLVGYQKISNVQGQDTTFSMQVLVSRPGQAWLRFGSRWLDTTIGEDFQIDIKSIVYFNTETDVWIAPTVTRDEQLVYERGFNGMHKVDELKGDGLHYTTLWRQYDPKTSRWMSREPKPVAWESLYASFRNNPIYYADPNGDWVKGAGFFRNVFNTDQKINAQDRAAELNAADPLANASAYKNDDGSWKVGYSSGVSVDLGDGTVNLRTVNIENFSKESKGNEFGSAVRFIDNGMDNLFESNPFGFAPESEYMGVKGAKKVADIQSDLGTGLSATPLAPVGLYLKGTSSLMRTFIDIENESLSAGDVIINTGIRSVTLFGGAKLASFSGKQVGSVVLQPGRRAAFERAMDLNINLIGDKIEETYVIKR